MDGVQLTQGYTSEGWKAESTLEPPSSFENRTLDWESSALTTRPLLHNIKTFSFSFFNVLTLLCMGEGEFAPPPLRIFLITFFSFKLGAWNFLTLSFYPLDTIWRNAIKKYWLVDKLWHVCHQWLEVFSEEKLFFLQTHVNVFY